MCVTLTPPHYHCRGLALTLTLSLSLTNVLCTESGVATRTDPTTPPPSLSLTLTHRCRAIWVEFPGSSACLHCSSTCAQGLPINLGSSSNPIPAQDSMGHSRMTWPSNSSPSNRRSLGTLIKQGPNPNPNPNPNPIPRDPNQARVRARVRIRVTTRVGAKAVHGCSEEYDHG